MDRRHLAVHGTENKSGATRVELVLGADGRPELLHPAGGGGRFARVFRGFVGAGRLPKPVAVKLERDEIDPQAGQVKFDNEYLAQVRVHENLKRPDRTRVVRMFEMWKTAGRECDTLPPTLLCPAGRQVVAPRCPGCGRELRDDLTCATCRGRQSPDAVRAATACPACRAAGTPCQADWLNRRPCKVLLLELLDLDLDDYLRWRWSPPAEPPTNRPAWAKLTTEHLKPADGRAADPTTTEVEELRFLLGLFGDALTGVRELHARRIPHLDLKPANLCLTLEGPAARLKVIDLGQSDSPNVSWRDWYESIFGDAAQRIGGGVYWAPEQRPERFVPVEVHWREHAGVFQLRLPAVDVAAGDVYCFPPSAGPHRLVRVVEVRPTDAGPEATAVPVAATWDAAAGDGGEWPDWRGPLADGCLVHQAGYAADLFALGMLLVHLVCRGRVDLSAFREHLHEVAAHLRAVLRPPALPARVAVEALAAVPHPEVAAVWRAVLGHRPAYPPLRDPFEELLGLALRAVVRGVPAFSYAQGRADEARDPTDRFAADIQVVRNRLNVLAQTHDLHSGRVAAVRRSGLAHLRTWLRAQPRTEPTGALPPYDRELFCHALDMLSGDAEHNERQFRLLLRRYHAGWKWLRDDVALFAKELKAHLTVAQSMHPVIVGMFDIVTPPAPRDGKPGLPPGSEARRVADALAALSAGRAEMTRHLDGVAAVVERFGQPPHQARLDDGVLGAIEEHLGGLSRCGAVLGEQVAVLRAWYQGHATGQRQRIAGWDRLDFGDADGWREFGRRVIGALENEEQAAAEWIRRTRAVPPALDDLAALVRRTLVEPWPAAKARDGRTLRGLCSGFVAALRRRPRPVRVTLAPDECARLADQLARARGRLTKAWPVPFEGRLAEALSRPAP